jgi:aminomethyltransferase
MPRPTPFYSRAAALCESQSWLEWSGFFSANQYELTHTHEYYAIRTAAALIDVSPLYKYHIHGRDAARLLNRVVTRDVNTCAVGQVLYTPWCDDDGNVIDDGTLARLDEHRFRLTAADSTLRWLEDNALGRDVHVEDASDSLAALALQGPCSRDILSAISNPPISNLKYYRLMPAEIAGVPATISRTGFTGDLGYEIWLEPQHAEKVWDALMDVGERYRLRAAGNLALDMARIEAGLLLVAVDFNSSKKVMFDLQKSTPYELGLGWTVKLDKDRFIGQAALKRELQRGPAWATVGLEVQLPALEAIYREFDMPLQLPDRPWSSAAPVFAGGRQIGKATSGMWSPILKKHIALARLKPTHAAPGTRVWMEVTIEAHRKYAEAVVVETPFFNPDRKKS